MKLVAVLARRLMGLDTRFDVLLTAVVRTHTLLVQAVCMVPVVRVEVNCEKVNHPHAADSQEL